MLQDGFKIKVVSTCGHSKGSVSVIINNEIAIVWDAMLETFKKSIFPPFADDIKGIINSWGRCDVEYRNHDRNQKILVP